LWAEAAKADCGTVQGPPNRPRLRKRARIAAGGKKGEKEVKNRKGVKPVFKKAEEGPKF